MLIGPSGCGQTTVLRGLARLDRSNARWIHAGGETWYESGWVQPPMQRRLSARALPLAPQSRLLLLDEPFAALDASGRDQLRCALKEILQESRIPTVLVTHDGAEALSLGDRFLVMQAGSLRPHPASDLREYALG